MQVTITLTGSWASPSPASRRSAATRPPSIPSLRATPRRWWRAASIATRAIRCTWAFCCVLAGWALFLSNAAAALPLPAFVAYMNRFQIAPEERILAAKFGAPFTDYLAAVRRWL